MQPKIETRLVTTVTLCDGSQQVWEQEFKGGAAGGVKVFNDEMIKYLYSPPKILAENDKYQIIKFMSKEQFLSEKGDGLFDSYVSCIDNYDFNHPILFKKYVTQWGNYLWKAVGNVDDGLYDLLFICGDDK